MALRKILNKSDEILHKKCKPVTEFDDKLGQLLDDMTETLKQAEGVGLAGPQVAKLRRVVVIIIDDVVYELVNPEILERSDEEQRVLEGCLSCPGECGYVTRPKSVKFKAQNRKGEWYEMEVSDLFAQCVCHELDHLEGHIFTEIVEEFVDIEAEQ
ncbi:MAG: peptide deformylase [Ruminococcus sp.]|nr:peptide deformylase [Ruminococcus sp.]